MSLGNPVPPRHFEDWRGGRHDGWQQRRSRSVSASTAVLSVEGKQDQRVFSASGSRPDRRKQLSAPLTEISATRPAQELINSVCRCRSATNNMHACTETRPGVQQPGLVRHDREREAAPRRGRLGAGGSMESGMALLHS